MGYIIIEEKKDSLTFIDLNDMKEIMISKLYGTNEWVISLFDLKLEEHRINKTFKSKSEACDCLRELLDSQHIEIINPLDIPKTKKEGKTVSYIITKDTKDSMILTNSNNINMIGIVIDKLREENKWVISLEWAIPTWVLIHHEKCRINKTFKSRSEAYEYLRKLFNSQQIEVINTLGISKPKKEV